MLKINNKPKVLYILLIMKWKQMSRFALKLSLGQIKAPKKLIALDIGSLSTGVAVSCPYIQKSYV